MKPKPQAETTPSLSVLDPDYETARLACPACETIYFVRQSANGREVQCKKCRQRFLVDLDR